MENMNWGTWLRGVISSLASGLITALGAIVVLKVPPDAWTFFIIGGIPVFFNFFSYIKQSPPPFGYKMVKEEIVSQVTKIVDIPKVEVTPK
jgi:hypothetical protein